MAKGESQFISRHFSNLSDPRRDNKRLKLIDIITIAICAVICNADSFEHIAEFGRAKHEWLKGFLDLPHGIPSTDTFERIFSRIDPEEFKNCFKETSLKKSIKSKRLRAGWDNNYLLKVLAG